MAGSRSNWPSAQRYSSQARFAQAPVESSMRSVHCAADTPCSTPITGMAGCCARAATGHAAAPPSATSNSRRPMVTVIRPSRARCVNGTIARHRRAVFTFNTSVVGFNCTTPAASFRERRHRGLARRCVAVHRRAVLMVAEGERNFLASTMGFGE